MELAPTGTLRAGVVQAPTAGVFFVQLDRDNQPHGVTVDLASALAREHNLPLALHVFPNSGECTDAVATAAVDVAFMPVDPARAARVAFGPAYYLLESTYLVSAASGLHSLPDVDRPGIRVIGIADTTTIRAAARTLAHTTPTPIRGVDEAIAMLRNNQADALALSRDSLNQIAPTIPGSRITPGAFQQTTISIAVPPAAPKPSPKPPPSSTTPKPTAPSAKPSTLSACRRSRSLPRLDPLPARSALLLNIVHGRRPPGLSCRARRR